MGWMGTEIKNPLVAGKNTQKKTKKLFSWCTQTFPTQTEKHEQSAAVEANDQH